MAPLLQKSSVALKRKLAVGEATRVQLETRLLPEHNATVERLEADRQWLSKREKEERVGKEHISKEHECEKDVLSLCSELFKEDYTDIQITLDALSYSTSLKLAAQAAELTSCERQVGSLSAGLRVLHDQWLHTVPRPCACSSLPTPGGRAGGLRAARRRRGQLLEVAHTLAMAELGSLRARHADFEVLPELNHALEWWAAGADDLCETVMRPSRRRCRRAIRAAHTVAPEMPAATPVFITQNLPALRLRYRLLLQKHSADHAALHQREVEVRAPEVHARTTVHALLQETRAADDRETRSGPYGTCP
ncbi:hypothetical protein H4582DRAFT_2132310, partial [Lactarius indigo]